MIEKRDVEAPLNLLFHSVKTGDRERVLVLVRNWALERMYAEDSSLCKCGHIQSDHLDRCYGPFGVKQPENCSCKQFQPKNGGSDGSKSA